MVNLILLKRRAPLTQDVDFHHGGGPAADVHSFYDICTSVASLAVCDRHCGLLRDVFNGDSLVWLQQCVSLCPSYFRLRLSSHSGWKLNLCAGFHSETSKELHIQEDLRSLCIGKKLFMFLECSSRQGQRPDRQDKKEMVNTLCVHRLDFFCGFAWLASPLPVQGFHTVGIPFAFLKTCHFHSVRKQNRGFIVMQIIYYTYSYVV